MRSRAARFAVEDQYAEPGQGLFVTDVSATGAKVRARQLLPVGTQIDVHFTFVEDDLYTIEGIADVVRRDVADGAMGLRFVWLSPESKTTLATLEAQRTISRRRRRVIPR